MSSRSHRKAHYIPYNKRSARPSNIIFFDTETTLEKTDDKTITHTLRLGVACHWHIQHDNNHTRVTWRMITEKGAFWDWVTQRSYEKTKLYLVAHNLAFDAQVLRMFPELASRGWQLLHLYEKGHTRIIQFARATPEYAKLLASQRKPPPYKGRKWIHHVTCLDDTNFFRGTLARWGDSLGFPKLNMPEFNSDNDTWYTYCKRDVEIMLKLWQEWLLFLDTHDLGQFAPTVGSQSFTAYRHRFMTSQIYVHDNQDAVTLEREAYKGGRCEPFFIGTPTAPHFWKLDINSMYPYVMATESYPTVLRSYTDNGSVEKLRWAIKRYLIVAEVSLRTPVAAYPVKRGKRNVYPVGEFTTTLTTPELSYALTHNHVTAVRRMACYKHADVFSAFVEYFYELKLQYNTPKESLHRDLVKLILNSLYGKFGQKGYKDTFLRSCPPELYEIEHVRRMDDNDSYTIYRAGGSVIRTERKGEGYNSFVAIAAHVTAYARMYLLSLMQIAGYHNTFYCDTDSLMVNQEGYQNLLPYTHPTDLGKMKIEGESDSLTINAPKDYCLGSKTVRKGIPPSARRLTAQSFQTEIWPSLTGFLNAQEADVYYNRIMTKHLTYSVNWGTLNPSGYVSPFQYPNEAG